MGVANIVSMASEDEELARAIALSLDVSSQDEAQGHSRPAPALMMPGSAPDVLNPAPAQASSSSWLPNMEAMQVLLSMGLSENSAQRGLYHTGNTSADHAASWVFENLENPDLHRSFSPPALDDPKADSKLLRALMDESRAYKMVFIVNTSLGMGVGKTAAQVGHATLALYKTLLVNLSDQNGVRDWEEGGAKKIVLKGENADLLLTLKSAAESKHIPSFLVKDAGKTEIKPGSITVLALFGKGYLVDEISGNLRLL